MGLINRGLNQQQRVQQLLGLHNTQVTKEVSSINKLSKLGLGYKQATPKKELDLKEKSLTPDMLTNVKKLDSGIILANLQDGKTRVIIYPDGTAKVGGHRAWRTNNPGNLRYTKRLAGIYNKFGLLDGDHEGDAYDPKWRGQIYPSMEAGNKARLFNLRKHYGDNDIVSIGAKYQTGLTGKKYREHLTKILPKGFDISKPIGKYSDEELSLLAKAQTQIEGIKEGDIYRYTPNTEQLIARR